MLEPTALSNSLSSLAKTQASLLSQFQKLASGKAINSAADNAAGLAQAASYSVQISGVAKAMAGMQDAVSLLDTAGGAVAQIGDNLQQMSELAVQAGNGALTDGDRNIIQDQIGQIGQTVDAIAGGTQFNGQKLLDGSFSRSLQAGAGQPVAIGNLSAAGLGVAALDVTTPAGREAAAGALNAALQRVSEQQAGLGAAGSGLDSGMASLAASVETLSAAKSRLAATDYAETASGLTQSKIQEQAAVKAVALYNEVQKGTLALLR